MAGSALHAIFVHADRLDDRLENEFGGRRMIEDEEAVKPSLDDTGYL